MKIFLIVLGVILIVLGLFLMLGNIMIMIEDISDTSSLASVIIGLILWGIAPVGLGIFFLYKAFKK